MTGNLTRLRTAYAGRPLLMLPNAALELGQRLIQIDGKAFARPSRLEALMAKLTGGRGPAQAMDDDDHQPVPLEARLAYAPLYVGEPDAVGFCWSLKDGVALMQADTALTDRGEEYCGVVYHGYDTLLAGMREAAADDRVRAIFLRAFSPGGVVAGGLQALSDWMLANRAAAGGKPIWIYADMAASAMYWIAACADRIVAPRVGLIGSIGAVIVHENYAKALSEYGLEITSIEFPLGKTDGAWWKALSPEARADWEAEIRQCGEDFFATVVRGRAQLTRDQLEGLRARCFMGHHDEAERSAVAIGLIDAIASEEEAFLELRDQVAQPASAPRTTGQTRAAATGERGVEASSQEKPMAGKAQTPPGRSAALQQAEAAVAEAQANLARIRAEDQGEGDQETESPEVPETLDTGETDDESDAAAIAASPEAKAEPALALAAIQSRQTLAQFKATVAAAATRPGAGLLATTLKDSPRLGVDGPGKTAGDALNPKAVYDRRKARAGGKSAAA